MKYIPHTINENTVTMVVDGRPKIVGKSHPNFAQIKSALEKENFSKAVSLLDNIVKTAEKIGGGDLTVVGEDVLFQGRHVPSYQARKLLALIRQGRKNITPLKNFIIRLMQNPSYRSQQEFARFADYKELPFDEDGFVYAYKGVQEDYWSATGNTQTRVLVGKVNERGQIYNAPGERIKIDRACVDDNCNNTCSEGVHAGSFKYSKNWSSKVVLVKIDPKDVVSVPVDCDGQKVRVSEYEVVSDYDRETDIEDSFIDTRPAQGSTMDVHDKITRYVQRKGLASLKQIQSTLKRHKLTQAQIRTQIRINCPRVRLVGNRAVYCE